MTMKNGEKLSFSPQMATACSEIIEKDFFNRVARKMLDELNMLNGMPAQKHVEFPEQDFADELPQPAGMPAPKQVGFTEQEIDAAGGSIKHGFDALPGDPPAMRTKVAASQDFGQSYYFLPDLPDAHEVAKTVSPAGGFDVVRLRQDFPALHQEVNGKPLIWLDNAATTQKPRCVIEKLTQFYEQDNSNVHRNAHALAVRATEAYEEARQKVKKFIGADCGKEIVFVRGATEAINLVAQTYGRQHISEGDEIIMSALEHHSNIVPWQLLCQEKGAVLRVIPISDEGLVDIEEFERLIGPRTRLVAVTHVSNVLGTVVPVCKIVEIAHAQKVPVLVDGAQAVPHLPVDIKAMDCDFYVFSGHKVFGPTGIGVLYGKKRLLDEMPPWQAGGHMIENVTIKKTTFKETPAKFEAGTPAIADAVGLGAALDYINKIGHGSIAAYEHMLMAYATGALSNIPGLRQFGPTSGKVGPLAFTIPGINPEELGAFLDSEGIAVRAGHHCAQPTMARFGVSGCVRPSLAFYNTKAEIDALAEAILKAKSVLKK